MRRLLDIISVVIIDLKELLHGISFQLQIFDLFDLLSVFPFQTVHMILVKIIARNVRHKRGLQTSCSK